MSWKLVSGQPNGQHRKVPTWTELQRGITMRFVIMLSATLLSGMVTLHAASASKPLGPAK